MTDFEDREPPIPPALQFLKDSKPVVFTRDLFEDGWNRISEESRKETDDLAAIPHLSVQVQDISRELVARGNHAPGCRCVDEVQVQYLEHNNLPWVHISVPRKCPDKIMDIE